MGAKSPPSYMSEGIKKYEDVLTTEFLIELQPNCKDNYKIEVMLSSQALSRVVHRLN